MRKKYAKKFDVCHWKVEIPVFQFILDAFLSLTQDAICSMACRYLHAQHYTINDSFEVNIKICQPEIGEHHFQHWSTETHRLLAKRLGFSNGTHRLLEQ